MRGRGSCSLVLPLSLSLPPSLPLRARARTFPHINMYRTTGSCQRWQGAASASRIARRFAAFGERTRRWGGRVVYVDPGCFAHPNCQDFGLGGASGGGRVRGRGTVPRRCGVGQTRKRVCGQCEIRKQGARWQTEALGAARKAA